jgi:hypothetical protein
MGGLPFGACGNRARLVMTSVCGLGSAVASGCVVTRRQPVLQIPGSVYVADGPSPHRSDT